MRPVIAIDGPAGAGKGTLAKRLAQHYEFDYLDTGLLYRAVGLQMILEKKDLSDEKAAQALALSLKPEDLQSKNLRDEAVASAASTIAAFPSVRKALLDFQREFALSPPGGKGAVLDGRDIGTTVCPEAAYKVFITASVEVRAHRRWKELQDRDVEETYEAVLLDIQRRDARDSGRETSPLVPHQDAFLVDTSSMTPQEVFDCIISFVDTKK